MSVKTAVRVAEVSEFVLESVIVKRDVPPTLMFAGEKLFTTVGLDGVTVSMSEAVLLAAFVLVTLAGGEMTAVLVTPVCA